MCNNIISIAYIRQMIFWAWAVCCVNFEFCEGRKDTDMIDYCRYVYTSWSANLPTSGWNFTRACMHEGGWAQDYVGILRVQVNIAIRQ